MKEIKQVVHESHSHSYELDITAFSDFIENRSDMIILVKYNGRYQTATGFDIATMIGDFQEATLPKMTRETKEDDDDLPF